MAPSSLDRLFQATVAVAGLLLIGSMWMPMADFPGLPFWIATAFVAMALLTLWTTRPAQFAALSLAIVAGLPLAGVWEETGQNIATAFALLALLRALWLWRTLERPRLNFVPMLITGLWLLWAWVAAMASTSPWVSLLHQGKLIAWVLGGIACGWLLSRERQAARQSLSLVVFVLLVLAIRALLRLPVWYKSATMPYWLDANFFSAALAMVLPLLAGAVWHRGAGSGALWRRIGAALMILFLLVAILHLRSRGAWVSLLAAGACLPLLLLPRARQLWIGLGILAMLLVAAFAFWPRGNESPRTLLGRAESIIDPHEFSNRERIMRWTCAWRMAMDRPILGHGPGVFPKTFKNYLHDEGEARQIAAWFGWKFGAHSDGMTSLAETGFLGFLLFWGMLGSWAWVLMRRQFGGGQGKMWSALGIASCLTWVVHGLVNDMLDNPSLTIGFFTMVGLMAVMSPEPGASGSKGG